MAAIRMFIAPISRRFADVSFFHRFFPGIRGALFLTSSCRMWPFLARCSFLLDIRLGFSRVLRLTREFSPSTWDFELSPWLSLFYWWVFSFLVSCFLPKRNGPSSSLQGIVFNLLLLQGPFGIEQGYCCSVDFFWSAASDWTFLPQILNESRIYVGRNFLHKHFSHYSVLHPFLHSADRH